MIVNLGLQPRLWRKNRWGKSAIVYWEVLLIADCRLRILEMNGFARGALYLKSGPASIDAK